MRKGIKVLAAIAAATTASAMSLSAFAANYTSSTVYDAAKSEYTTTTNVTDAGTDEVAYLVTKANATGVDENSIVFIDQKQAVDGNVEFTFTFNAVDVAKFKDADIKVGTTSTAASNVTVTNPGTDNKVVVPNTDITVTYSVDGEGGRVLAVTSETNEVGAEQLVAEGKATASNQLSFVVAPDMGYKLATVNNEAAAPLNSDGLYTVSVSETAKNFVFKFEEDTTETTPTVTLNQLENAVEITDAKNSVMSYAGASLNSKGAGMYFAATADALGATNEAALKAGHLPKGVAHVAALKIGSDGKYAIRLAETFDAEYTKDNAFISETMYARAYVEDANGNRILSDTIATLSK